MQNKSLTYLWVICGIALFVIVAVVTCIVIYRHMDRKYQEAMDPIRMKHAEQITNIVLEYAVKTDSLPFESESIERPFMVLIGHSPEMENVFANDKVLARNAKFANSHVLEKELSRVLGREIKLPRDPQKVPTYAPNVYVYYIAEGQLTVAVHLYAPSDHSFEYNWRGGTFYRHTLTYGRSD
ncbi:hypothetical protein SMSP2_01620 [Limihaloglobus sulfuriphilus]|uniref:Uncharacterized protein n=1 Tax=Limihaloglobus sulfuriphilus TaxID=1851148 RepID=A0A1Q2MF25_9BACT|nr:hypothetical protein [Limihaloglobus sulfuriphilus]AQQ71254.1 hypothetical protein SMSP2_01620 [Limihaloglobus sulfuriphilus]